MPHPHSPFIQFWKSPVDEPSSRFPIQSLYEEMPVSRAFSKHPSGSPAREPFHQVPLTKLPQREALHLQSPFQPYHKVPGRWAHSSLPNWAPHKERFPSPEPSFHNLQDSQKRSPLQVPLTELPQREMPLLQSPLSTVSQSSRWMNLPVPWALLPISFRIPRKEPPNRAPAKKDAPFPEPSNYLLKFPGSGLPRSQNGSLRREASVSRAFFYAFSSKSLVNEPPFVPNRVPMERGFISRASGLFVHSFTHLYLSESPIRSPPTKNGENIWPPCTEPHVDGRPTYNGVRAGSLTRSFTTLQSLPQCHAAFSTIPSTLAWIDQSPVTQHVS